MCVRSLRAPGGSSAPTRLQRRPPTRRIVLAQIALFLLVHGYAMEGDVLSSASAVLHLRSDAAFQKARAKHPRIMILAESKYDPSCKLAADLFVRAAATWSANVSFARIDVDEAPRAAALVGDGPLPWYALALDHLTAPVRYSGGWSEASIGAWLHRQLAFAPTTVRDMRDVARLARTNPHGLLILGLLSKAQRGSLQLEQAARASGTHATVAILEDSGQPESNAAQLMSDILQPCILVVRRDATEPWAALRPPHTQRALEAFLSHRAMPLVVALGDSRREFSRHVRTHPLRFHVLLIHMSGARGAHYESDQALAELQRVAATTELARRVLFLAYDFFDNEPDQFTSREVHPHHLPTLLVYHDRGGPAERMWRMPVGAQLVREGISAFVEGALKEVSDSRHDNDQDEEDDGKFDIISPPDGYQSAVEACEGDNKD